MEIEYARRTGHERNLREIAALAETDDAEAQAVIAEAAEVLGAVLGSANNVVDAEIIVVAGGVLALGDRLLQPARAPARRGAGGLSAAGGIGPAK